MRARRVVPVVVVAVALIAGSTLLADASGEPTAAPSPAAPGTTASPSPSVRPTPATEPAPTEPVAAPAEPVVESGEPDATAEQGTTTTTAVSVLRTFPAARTVDRVTMRTAPGAVHEAFLRFGDGSRLLVTPAADGSGTVLFPARTVDSVSLTLYDAAGAAVRIPDSDWAVDAVGAGLDNRLAGSTATTSYWATSNAGGVSALSLIDGDPATGSTGNEWAPNPHDTRPSVGLGWDTPQELSSVQIIGPSTTGFDPGYDAAAELYGQLVFDDGSTVEVAGIDAGEGQPTTIAFAPRMSTSVELRLAPTIRQAWLGLREFRAYPRGITPPRWSGGLTAPTRTVTAPPAAGCGPGSGAVGTSVEGALALVCPSPGATVDGTATVVVQARAGATVDASAARPGTAGLPVLATAVADGAGRAVLQFPTAGLQRGPLAVKVVQRGANTTAGRVPLHVQLFNAGGIATSAASSAPAGMTLQWAEEFRTPLSVSRSGSGAVYAATKPAYWGASEFGEAYFADPAEGRDTLAVVGGDYLRIRTQPISRQDPWGWSRQHESGLLSSGKVGATGFAAQYGYFEARILGAGGRGTWPAFWMLDSPSGTKRATASGEVDAVELYGHGTTSTCHSVHSWVEGSDADSEVTCVTPATITDWATTWHTYGVQFRPDGADYYVDGRLVATQPAFYGADHPFYFMLNLSLGGGWPIALQGTGNTVDMYVDWVRVYS